MNRAERRRQEKAAAKNPTYMVDQAMLSSIKNSATKQAVEASYPVMLSFAIKVLKNEFGWGDYMINKFLECAVQQYDDAKADTKKMISTFEDFSRYIKED